MARTPLPQEPETHNGLGIIAIHYKRSRYRRGLYFMGIHTISPMAQSRTAATLFSNQQLGT